MYHVWTNLQLVRQTNETDRPTKSGEVTRCAKKEVEVQQIWNYILWYGTWYWNGVRNIGRLWFIIAEKYVMQIFSPTAQQSPFFRQICMNVTYPIMACVWTMFFHSKRFQGKYIYSHIPYGSFTRNDIKRVSHISDRRIQSNKEWTISNIFHSFPFHVL